MLYECATHEMAFQGKDGAVIICPAQLLAQLELNGLLLLHEFWREGMGDAWRMRETERGHSSEGDTHLGPGAVNGFQCATQSQELFLFQTIVHFINCRMIIKECEIICHLHMQSHSFSKEPITMDSRFSYLFFFVKSTIEYALRMLSLTFYIWI